MNLNSCVNLIFLLLLGLVACQPAPLDIEIPQHQPRLVISSQVVQNEGVLVSVSKSFSSLSGHADSLSRDSSFLAQLVVNHARVTLSYNGKTHVLQRTGPGLYAARLKDMPFHARYSLHVKDTVSGLECSASATMLPPALFDSVVPIVTRTPKDTAVFLSYSLTDTHAGKNYYLVSVVATRRKKAKDLRDLAGLKKFEYQAFLLSDDAFTNGRYTARERLDVRPQDTIVVSLTNISEDYFRYLTLYLKAGSYYNQLTGEPVQFPTNVQQGYGFFNLHNPSGRTFLLEEF